jgi:hypothetical protein
VSLTATYQAPTSDEFFGDHRLCSEEVKRVLILTVPLCFFAVNIVITPLSADYTKMGSFGSAEAFGETLVSFEGL